MEVELGPAGPAAWQRQLVMDPMQRPPAWARPSAFAAPPLPFNAPPFNAPLQVETEAPRDEARQSFLDLGHDGRHGHRVPWRQYVSLAVWYLLLVMEYIVVRIVCQFDIPRDCKPHGNLDTIFDLQVMFMMGFMLAILTGVHMPDRFAYLFCFKGPRPRGIAFLLVMVVSGPVWGSLDTIDSLSRISFTSSFFEESFVNVLIGLAFGAAAAFLLLWHFYCAFMHNQISGFLAYTGSRLSIWIFYGVYLYIAATTTNVEVHLHHYVIGFLIAILAEFNHPISLVVLAAGTGIFVQGISAYHADALTEVGSLQRAAFCFEEMIVHNPRSMYTILTYAELLYSVGDFETSRKYFSMAAYLDEMNLRALWGLATCNMALAEKDKAREKTKQFQELQKLTLERLKTAYKGFGATGKPAAKLLAMMTL